MPSNSTMVMDPFVQLKEFPPEIKSAITKINEYYKDKLGIQSPPIKAQVRGGFYKMNSRSKKNKKKTKQNKKK